MNEIRQKIVKFCTETTIHGPNLLIGETFMSRQYVFFALFFLSAAFAAAYGIVQLALQMVHVPISTSVLVVRSTELQLPDVTICPFARFNQAVLDSYGVSEDLARYIEWMFLISSKDYDYRKPQIPKMLHTTSINKTAEKIIRRLEREQRELLQKNNFTLLEFAKLAGFHCKDFVKACYDGHQHKFDCCEESAEVLTGMSNCVRLRNMTQRHPGFGHGVTIEISLPHEKYVLNENNLLNDGIMVKLTEPGKGYDFDAAFVKTGTHTLMQLETTRMQFMDVPGMFRCHEDKGQTDYAPLLCYQQCMMTIVIEHCGCRYAGLPETEGTENYTVCNTSQMLLCVYGALNIDAAKRSLQCRNQCRIRCEYFQYKMFPSHAAFPGQTSRRWLSAEDVQRKQERDIVLTLFYGDLLHNVIKHYQRVTASTVIANVGGQLGLWIGASIVSFIHFVTFVLSIGAIIVLPSAFRNRKINMNALLLTDVSQSILRASSTKQSEAVGLEETEED